MRLPDTVSILLPLAQCLSEYIGLCNPPKKELGPQKEIRPPNINFPRYPEWKHGYHSVSAFLYPARLQNTCGFDTIFIAS